MDILVEAGVQCPHCWEKSVIEVDTSLGDFETVEDCSVCCVPMTLRIACRSGQVVSIEASP